MKTAELLETLRTRQPLSWRQVRDRLPLSLPRQSRLDLASDDRYPQESDYGGGLAIVDFLDMKDGWAGPGTFAPSRMIIRNARAFLSRVSAVNRIVPCVSLPREEPSTSPIIWMRTGTYPSRWATTSWLRPRTLTVMTCSLSGTGMMPSHGSFWRLWPRDAL